MKNQRERLIEWVKALTRDQIDELVVDLVVNSIGSEDVSFYSDTISPYWSHTGDPLIEGQKTYADDD